MRNAGIALLVGTALLSLRPSASCAAGRVTFHPSLDEARKTADAKPVVLYFTASWCGWCRRMETEVFPNETAAEALAKFEWVKVDIDERKELAARYRVRGAPVLVVLNAQDEVVASRAGFLPADKLADFLTAGLQAPAKAARQSEDEPLELPDGDKLAAALKEGDARQVERAVRQLARADRGHRRRILDAFASAGNAAWPALLELMESDRLATRAAAATALDHASRAGLPFHPFAPPPRRELQIVAWTGWLKSRGIEIVSQPAEAELPDAAR